MFVSSKRWTEKYLLSVHPGADSFGEFFGFFPSVVKEGVGFPANDEHDGVDGLPWKVHRHHKGGLYGV